MPVLEFFVGMVGNQARLIVGMDSSLLILSDPAPGVRILTLNRPHVINAINEEICILLDAALHAAARDENVRCLVLTGSGTRGFSAGYDLQELSGYSENELRAQNLSRYDWVWNLAAHPKPVIAAIHGICFGAGAILAACADIRLGSEDTAFRVTAAAYGAAMSTWRLPELVGDARAREYLMTSRIVHAEEALAAGLLNKLVKQEDLLPEAVHLATQIAEHPPAGPQNIKHLLLKGSGQSAREKWQLENDLLQSTPYKNDISSMPRKSTDQRKTRP